jgi:hypothetical protein
MNDQHGHGLLLPFDTDNEDFTRGFEAGHVWTRLRDSGFEQTTFTVHAENAEMMLRIAEALGVTVQSEELGDGWLEVEFS